MLHEVYNNEGQVRALTVEHLRRGNTVLQMFQLADSEVNHSLRVLDMVQVPECGSVLSLGCGVGGMEAHWHDLRPEVTFELVNRSQAQLDLCVCHGKRVCADITHYRSEDGPFDLTVLAYVLGHLDEPATALASARANTKKGGIVLVLDVFDGTAVFDEHFHYSTLLADDMRAAGFVEEPTVHPWRLMPLIHHDAPWVPRHATPQAWIRRV